MQTCSWMNLLVDSKYIIDLNTLPLTAKYILKKCEKHMRKDQYVVSIVG